MCLSSDKQFSQIEQILTDVVYLPCIAYYLEKFRTADAAVGVAPPATIVSVLSAEIPFRLTFSDGTAEGSSRRVRARVSREHDGN